MSIEEDTELRDLVQQALESNGSLAKIRAQIRACTFMALLEEEKLQNKQPQHNNKVKTQLEQAEGQLMFALVHEFLEYYNMDYTLKLYEAETYQSAYSYKGRNKLLSDLQVNEDDTSPVLTQLVRGTAALKEFTSKNFNISEPNLDEAKHKAFLNETFNIHVDSKPNTPRSAASEGKEDTFDGTSSIPEDSIKEKSTDAESGGAVDTEHSHVSQNASINGFSDKSEKSSRSNRSKSARDSNKSREFVLPSLYSSNQEFEDNLDNYEEDFMSTSEVDSVHYEKSLKSPAAESVASSINSEDLELNSTVEDILKST